MWCWRRSRVELFDDSQQTREQAQLPKGFQSSAIEIQRHARDVARAFRAEKNDRVREFLGLAEAVERILARRLTSRLLFAGCAQLLREALRVAPPEVGVDPARAHGVHENVVFTEL